MDSSLASQSLAGPISDSTIERYQRWMPALSRLEIFDAILAAGPAEAAIESELLRRVVHLAFRPRPRKALQDRLVEAPAGVAPRTVKPSLTPGQLHGLIKGLLAITRTAPCGCRVPLPSLIGDGARAAPNWGIGAPLPCERGCHSLIQEIADEVSRRLDMKEPGGPRD